MVLERDVLAYACMQDFELFARRCIGVTHPKNKKGVWWDDAVHRPLCAWFQKQADSWLASRDQVRSRRYLAILIPRNCAKSLLITRIGMLWLHLRDPNLSTYIGNEKLDLAEEFLGTIKSWLSGDPDPYCLFNWLYGSWRSDNQRWRRDVVTHAARTDQRGEASFGIWSPTSALTGRHPDILCMDDLVSYDALKKDANWFAYAYDHMTDLIPVVEPNGLVLLVGTRYGDADPFGRSFKSDGIATLSGHTDFQEYVPRPHGRWHVFFLSGRTLSGEPAIPSVWTEDEMRGLEARDPFRYACQVLNRPNASSLRPLRESEFDGMVVKEFPARGDITFHMDTAFKRVRELAKGSETALDIALHHEGGGAVTIVEAISSIQFRSATFADLLIEQYQHWTERGYRVIAMTDEDEQAGKSGAWETYLQDRFAERNLNMPGFFIFNRRGGEKKEARITNSINFITNGQVYFYEGCRDLPLLKKQLCDHPYAFPNDLADAFADIFSDRFYTGILPRAQEQVRRPEMGAFEQQLKPRWYEPDTMDTEEPDRPPIGGAPASRLL